MDEMEIVEVLEQTATDFNEEFKPEELPDIQLGKFLTITTEGNRETEEKAYGEMTGTQDLDNGLIDENTTSLETEDINIKAKKMGYIDWGKSVVYTSLAVVRAQKLGIALDTAKLDNLRGVAWRTIQKTALLGHARRADVTGLLNNQAVHREDFDKRKKLSEMTGAEARKFFIDLVRFGYDNSDGIVMPDTIALDAGDLLTLSSTYDPTITNGQTNINAITAIREALRDFAGYDINIVGIPQGFALGAGSIADSKGKAVQANRAVVYCNTADVVKLDMALAPSAGEVFKRSTLSYEIPVEAQFTGALIQKLDRFAYVDYLG